MDWSHTIAFASLCFVIGGITIPIFGPQLVLMPNSSRIEKIIGGSATVVWAIALSNAVVYYL